MRRFKEKWNKGHFWFADLVCLRIVERGKRKVLRRIKYALFYSTGHDKRWSGSGLSKLFSLWDFPSFDGGCLVKRGVGFDEKRKLWVLAFAAILYQTLLSLYPPPIKNTTFILSVSRNNLNIFIFITDTEKSPTWSGFIIPEISTWKYAMDRWYFLRT